MYKVIEVKTARREKDQRTDKQIIKYDISVRVVPDETKRCYNGMWWWNMEDILEWYGLTAKEYREEFYKKKE